MDGREHEPETVFRAQELYCVDRLTYGQVSEAIAKEIEPVAVSTLKRWSSKFEWRERREEIAQALADISGDTILARSKLLKSLLKKPDPQMGFAVASMETLAMRQVEAARAGRIIEPSAKFELRTIRTPEDAVTALKEARDLKFNRLLSDPSDLDFKALQDIERVTAKITEMEAQLSTGTVAEEEKGLSLKTADEIRRDILGMK